MLNRDGSLQRSVYNFPTPAQAWLENLWLTRLTSRLGLREDFFSFRHDITRDVPWVVGACMLVRRQVFEAVGGFDERFFMYAEEADWQRRVGQGGFRIRFVHSAIVTHLGGASGVSEKAKINRHFFESLDKYTSKHHGRLGLLSLHVAMVLGCSMRLALWAAAGLVRPAKRGLARSKIKLHSWLVYRQIFTWRLTPAG